MRKHPLMIQTFGESTGLCKDCPYLMRLEGSRVYYKCQVYGSSGSEATDWALSYPACGAKDKTVDELKYLMGQIRYRATNDNLDIMPGQMTLG